jgi:hypothetical protein
MAGTGHNDMLAVFNPQDCDCAGGTRSVCIATIKTKDISALLQQAGYVSSLKFGPLRTLADRIAIQVRFEFIVDYDLQFREVWFFLQIEDLFQTKR